VVWVAGERLEECLYMHMRPVVGPERPEECLYAHEACCGAGEA